MHLLPVLQWKNEQKSVILSSLDSDYTSDDQSVIVSATRLSTMSGDQASDLKDLEGNYEEILDENCRAFAEYFMEVLQNEDGNKLVDPPRVVLGKNRMAEKFHHSEDEEMEIGGFRFKNGRYNVMLYFEFAYILALLLLYFSSYSTEYINKVRDGKDKLSALSICKEILNLSFQSRKKH